MNNEEIIFPVSYFSYTKMNDENLLIIDETILGYISAKRMSYQELLIFLRLKIACQESNKIDKNFN